MILAEIRFYREGLARFFADRGGFDVVGTAQDVATAVQLAHCVRFDVALVDTATPRAMEAIQIVRAAVPTTGIVAIGVREREDEVITLAEAGAFGFVFRDASLEDLCRAVEGAARDESPCSARVAAMLVRRVSALATQVAERRRVPLTRRQLEIVTLIDEGLPNKAIARRLFIELPTVKNHVHNILERLEVSCREEVPSAVRRLSAGVLPRSLGPRSSGSNPL